MTFLAFFIPLFIFYTLLLFSLCASIVACVGAFRSRRRHRWILVTGLLALLVGGGLNYYYQTVIWSAAEGALWFTILGLAPIPLGIVSLIRWFLLEP